MSKIRLITSLPMTLLGAALLAAQGSAAADAADPGTALKLSFVEQEKGIDPYATRMLVTPKYLRIDDGAGSKDFVLFDRASRIIYDVNAEDGTIMTVEPHAVDIEPPDPLKLSEDRLGSMKDAPTVAGKAPVHYRLNADGKECANVVAVDGLLPDAVAALRAYRQVLAGESARTLNLIPADVRNACDMAADTFAPARHLAHGFPIQQWDAKGYSRMLTDFDPAFVPEQGVFVLPEGYKRFSIDDLREGRAFRPEPQSKAPASGV